METLDLLLKCAAPTIVERVELAPRTEQRAPFPEPYRSNATASWLAIMAAHEDSLWTHQARALAVIAAGEHVVVSTSTASGKTLIFQTPIIHELLTGSGVALVLYPQKALGGDQLARWREALDRASLPVDLVGEIHGDIPMCDRAPTLECARIILATPDVVHAWLLRQVTAPVTAAFLRRLRFLVIDEAHVLEGAFGSNCAYLFRRLRSARTRLLGEAGHDDANLQIIAATATILDPADHLERLTGCPFTSVTEAQNGAPSAGGTLLHIDGPAFGEPAETMLADILASLAQEIAPNAFIAFADSRQGVERIARRIKREDVLPYRSGFERSDRRAIEAALRAGQLRGVISTSALELGIDIPQFTIGFNLGIPQSRKALRQRVGRVGRVSRGAFAVITPSHSFAQLGSSFRTFFEGSVEPSYLYSDNRFIQFAQARCLLDECEVTGAAGELPADVEWPEGFAEIYRLAQPGASRPRELDHVAALGGDNPHHNYPLRHLCETSFSLRDTRDPNTIIGSIDLAKALREAYPGAVHYHYGRSYRVVEWRNRVYERSIRVEKVASGSPTKPLLQTLVNVSVDPQEIIGGRYLAGSEGQMAEIHLRVNEAVEGYRTGAATLLYSELRKTDPRKTRKQREFSTTGILIRIAEPWFSGREKAQLAAREAVARALQQLVTREYSIAPADVVAAHSNIALCSLSGAAKIDDAIVLYDNVLGGLRLTAPLFDRLGTFIERLLTAATLAGADALVSADIAERLTRWHSGLGGPATTGALGASGAPAKQGEHIIYAPQSEVGIRFRGSLLQRTLLGPQIVMLGDEEVLMYRYESSPDVQALVPHSQIEATGQNWRRAVWTPATGMIRDLLP